LSGFLLNSYRFGPTEITSFADFNSITVVGSSYTIRSPNSATGLVATVNNGPNGRKGISLGSFSFTGTSFVQNNQNIFSNRTLVTTTFTNLQRVSEVFITGRLVWTTISGVSEQNFDFYSISASFNNSVAAGVERSGSTNAIYEQTVNSHTTSNLNSTFVLRYRTDGSVDGGRGWNDNSGTLWFTV
jgi:hypothetical protein